MAPTPTAPAARLVAQMVVSPSMVEVMVRQSAVMLFRATEALFPVVLKASATSAFPATPPAAAAVPIPSVTVLA